ncbi:hypothetical protein BE61_65080 [Bradyrhizobium elkanii USDA 61]|jgi:hypothetical protein|nr:hypothetical protein BE61_65080 [Bradyrhizobium elkanii USDA 61]
MRRLGKTAAAPSLAPASWPRPRSAHRRRSRALGGCAGTPMRPMPIRVNPASWFTAIGAGVARAVREHEGRDYWRGRNWVTW